MVKTCNMCGECCHGFNDRVGVPVFPSEIIEIAKLINISPRGFIEQYCYYEEVVTGKKSIGIYYLNDIAGTCVFLRNKKCSIHIAKPYQCTRWPSSELLDSVKDKPCITTEPYDGISFDEEYPSNLLSELFDDLYRRL